MKHLTVTENSPNLSLHKFNVTDPDANAQVECTIDWLESSFVDGEGVFVAGQDFSVS